jgi:Cu(I)/Ag(I) efflux system membrane fusion protein
MIRAAGAVVLASAGLAAGYWLRADISPTPTVPAKTAQTAAAQPSANRKPLYYQDPDGKPDYSPTPKKAADGRDFKPVYGSNEQPARPTKNAGKGKILYYRDPMGLPVTSPVPKKDAMGMAYVPVYAGGDESGVVEVSPARLQMLGVTTTTVQTRPNISRMVRATGVVQAPENTLADVSPKFDVVVEKLFVATTGAHVHAGQPLARVWIATPDTMMQRGPDVITREIDYVIALQEKNPAMIAQTESVLRQYGIPESAIAEIRRTGHATREITITAPRSGIIIEKPAVVGMRINTGDLMFKIADLSQVWVMADIQERDLGAVRVGQAAKVNFVAFPGRSVAGKVDFIYPTLTPSTRTGRVRIVLPNSDGLLRESMYATVTITFPAATQKILAVPNSAVIDSGTRQVVLVQKGPGQFAPETVQIGARGDGYAQVLSGLKAGERVVTSANFLIDAESNLRAALQTFTGGSNSGQQGGAPQ